MKYLLLFSLIFSGCAVPPKRIRKWNGENIKVVSRAWGTSYNTKKLEDGGSVSAWVRTREFTTRDSEFFPSTVERYEVYYVFQTDPEGKITEIKMKMRHGDSDK